MTGLSPCRHRGTSSGSRGRWYSGQDRSAGGADAGDDVPALPGEDHLVGFHRGQLAAKRIHRPPAQSRTRPVERTRPGMRTISRGMGVSFLPIQPDTIEDDGAGAFSDRRRPGASSRRNCQDLRHPRRPRTGGMRHDDQTAVLLTEVCFMLVGTFPSGASDGTTKVSQGNSQQQSLYPDESVRVIRQDMPTSNTQQVPDRNRLIQSEI